MLKFKKLNNKGVTLVELIVSFAIVSFAVIYFYQTLTTVTKMYTNAKKEIAHSANVNYAYRLFDEAYESGISPEELCYDGGILAGIVQDCENNDDNDEFYTFTFDIDEREYTLYKYPKNTESDDFIEDDLLDEDFSEYDEDIEEF